jgi:hypothetical protein
VRSPRTLGIVFIFPPCLVAYYAGQTHISVVTWALMGLLVLAGVCVMLGLRVGTYLGIAGGAAMALAGVFAWAGLGGAKAALPINPAIAVVIGLYLCARVATTKAPGALTSKESESSS